MPKNERHTVLIPVPKLSGVTFAEIKAVQLPILLLTLLGLQARVSLEEAIVA